MTGRFASQPTRLLDNQGERSHQAFPPFRAFAFQPSNYANKRKSHRL